MNNFEFIVNGTSYRFEVKRTLSGPQRTGKGVYVGCFPKNAPPGLTPGTMYCLKKAVLSIQNMKNTRVPQNREYWDFKSFDGRHLRETLVVNDETNEMFTKMKKGKEDNKYHECMSIEPLYYPVLPGEFTFDEKMQILEQITEGLLELRDKHGIIAHRDLKLANVLLSFEDGAPCVKLIDFASVKSQKLLLQSQTDTTCLVGMSRSNTAPEYVLSGLENTSGKCDIFALGMILAELFGLFPPSGGSQSWNPLCRWIETVFPLDMPTLTSRYDEVYGTYGNVSEGERSWLEQEMGFKVSPEWEEADLVGLFRRCVLLDPGKRPELDEVRDMLRSIRNNMFPVIMIDRSDLDAIRTKCAGALETYGIAVTERKYPLYVCHSVPDANLEETSLESRGIGGSLCKLSDIHRLLADGIGSVNSGQWSGLAGAVSQLLNDMQNHRDIFRRFNGEIHVFCRRVPEMLATVNGKTLDVWLGTADVKLNLHLYCDIPFEGKTPEWCADIRALDDPHRPKVQQNRPEAAAPVTGGSAWKPCPNDLFIRGENGERLYIVTFNGKDENA